MTIHIMKIRGSGNMTIRILSVGIEKSKFLNMKRDLEKTNIIIFNFSSLNSLHKFIGEFEIQYDWILIENKINFHDISLFIKNNDKNLNKVNIIISCKFDCLSQASLISKYSNIKLVYEPFSSKNIESSIISVEKSENNKSPLAKNKKYSDSTFVGQSKIMLDLYDKISRLAQSKSTVLITGESGTGKEVCAEALHRHGPRHGKAFVAVNCGSIPENLIESELFGHAKGAFTGAAISRDGAVIAANGGTLFLDEICEMPLQMQVKLLRFLQSGSVQRIGDARPVAIDVRILAATNRNPEEEVAAGRFREDLYYRLNVVRLEMPPLRDRGEDYAFLANHYLEKFAAEEGRAFEPLSQGVLARLGQRKWPGNVRELQNAIRRAVALNDGPYLDEDQFQTVEVRRTNPEDKRSHLSLVASNEPPPQTTPIATLTYDEIERRAIEDAIDRCGGSLPIAARQLGISASTMYRKRERWLRSG
jgi:two-component system, repressor protein LuxO